MYAVNVGKIQYNAKTFIKTILYVRIFCKPLRVQVKINNTQMPENSMYQNMCFYLTIFLEGNPRC
jgi:hypothetical protein